MIPPGWRLVRVEPTEHQLRSARPPYEDLCAQSEFDRSANWMDAFRVIYAAMVQASPPPPEDEDIDRATTVDLNDAVLIKLNDSGREILRQQHERLRAAIPSLGEFKPRTEDADGFSRFQLWTLMETFGPYISLGRIPPFETTIRLLEGPQ